MHKNTGLNLPANQPKYSLILAIVFVFVVQLYVTIINTNNDFIWVSDDYALNYLFPQVWKRLSENMWDAFTGTGKVSVTSTFGFIWANLISSLKNIGLSVWFIERLMLFTFLLLTNLTSFFFFKSLCTHSENIDKSVVIAAALVGSWLYTFSIYVLSMLSFLLYSYHFYITFTPLLLILVNWNVRNKPGFSGIILSSLILIFLFGSNFSQLVLILILTIAYYLFLQCNNQVPIKAKKLLGYPLGVILITTLLSLYIWLPLVSFSLSGGGNPYGDVGDQFNSMLFNSRRGQMTNTFMGTSFPWFDSLNYGHSYSQSICVIVSGIILFGFVSFVFLSRRNLHTKIFWFSVMLIAIFFAKGFEPPFSDGIKSLLLHFPAFGMFRAVYFKFWFFVALGLGALATLVMIDLGVYFHRKNYGAWLLILLGFSSVIGVNRFPFFTGKMVQEKTWTQLPQEYFELEQFFSKFQQNGKVLALPATPRGAGSILLWPNNFEFVGPHILGYMSVPYIDAAWFIQRKYFNTTDTDWWADCQLEGAIKKLLSASSIFSTRWIFIQKDGAKEYTFGNEKFLINGPKKARLAINYLDNQANIKKIRDNTFFSLYEIASTESKPHIHVS